jgi:hypothetical protein
MTVSAIMLLTGSILTIGWGFTHLSATKAVVTGFGTLAAENRMIILMEWVAEGLTLCFLGLLVLVMAILGGKTNPYAVLVCRLSSLLLLTLAGLGLMTGAKSSLIPLKIGPWAKTGSALLILLGTL